MTTLANNSPRNAAAWTIREWITAGILSGGQALPAERELASRLGVGRPSVRWALNALEQEGLIESRGPRTRVVSVRSSAMEHSIVVLAPSPTEQDAQLWAGPGWSVKTTSGVYAKISELGYNMVSVHPARVTGASLRWVVEGRPAGVVFPDLVNFEGKREWLEALTSAGIPCTVYGNGPELQTFDRVTSDHDAGAYALTNWLIAHGRRKIMMFFGLGEYVYWVRGRRSGYERAMREAGLEPLPTLIYPNSSVSGELPAIRSFDATRRHMAGYLVDSMGDTRCPARADALMLMSDGLTYAAAAACRLLGREPGRDVEIVGYDNYLAQSHEREWDPYRPPVTVDKHNEEMGHEMVRLLMDRLEKRLPQEPQVRIVQPQLVVTDP